MTNMRTRDRKMKTGKYDFLPGVVKQVGGFDDYPDYCRLAQVWKSNTFTVWVFEDGRLHDPDTLQPLGGFPPVWWLSIKRTDRTSHVTWSDMQNIKDKIIGPEHEGFEVYPARSRLVNTSNQRSMFVFKNDVRTEMLPVGYGYRQVMTPREAMQHGAVQDPLGPESTESPEIDDIFRDLSPSVGETGNALIGHRMPIEEEETEGEEDE